MIPYEEIRGCLKHLISNLKCDFNVMAVRLSMSCAIVLFIMVNIIVYIGLPYISCYFIIDYTILCFLMMAFCIVFSTQIRRVHWSA